MLRTGLFTIFAVSLGLLAYDEARAAKPVCGDSRGQGKEECDGSDLRGSTCESLGLGSGTLTCTAGCTLDTSGCGTTGDVCGDGAVTGSEECDGADMDGKTCENLGLGSGTLTCTAACTVDTSGCGTTGDVCGDGAVTGSEECDGADMDDKTCENLGLGSGTLTCTAACTVDTSGCGTTGGDVCGDGAVAGFEECDGGDDDACPGACSAHCACPAAVGDGTLQLHMIDVGQGDAILLVSPDGFVTLLDAGTEGEGATVTTYLDTLGLTGIDYTVASHMDSDHIGGLDVALAAFGDAVACFDHGGTHGTAEFAEYDAAAAGRRVALGPGDAIDMGPSITVDVLHGHTGTSVENDNSVVLLVTFGDLSFLLGGDCEGPCEATLNPGHVDVYKVHHHGSGSSSTDAFLDRITPYTALISAGIDNPHGHPHQAVLDRLAAHRVTVYGTYQDGDLEVSADGAAYTVNGEPVCAASEARACLGLDVGACDPGARSCVGGMWGACEGAVGPTSEDCNNGLDDDCDGATDGADLSCAGQGVVLLAQVGYDTPGTDSVEEFVDLFNPTDVAVSLDGWVIADGAASWAFPAGVTVAPGAWLSVARDVDGFVALHGKAPDVTGMTLALNNTGDELRLYDDTGVEVDYVAWEGYDPAWPITAGVGDSIERVDPTVDNDAVSDWAITAPAAPRGGETGPGALEATVES